METVMAFGIVYLFAISILGFATVLIDANGQDKEPWASVSPAGRNFMASFLTPLAIGNVLSLGFFTWRVAKYESPGILFVIFFILELLTIFLAIRSVVSLFRASSLGGVLFLGSLCATTLTFFLGLWVVFGSSTEFSYPLSRIMIFLAAGLIALFAGGSRSVTCPS